MWPRAYAYFIFDLTLTANESDNNSASDFSRKTDKSKNITLLNKLLPNPASPSLEFKPIKCKRL